MSEIEAIAAEIDRLSPPDRLRLAASLMEAGKANLGHAIAEKVVLELGAALAAVALLKGEPSPTHTEDSRR